MAELFTNGAKGRLVASISAGALGLTLRSGQGALFPAYGAGDSSWLVLEQGTAATPTKREIVQVTARAGDVLTIVRAQQGTTALAFDAGARCEMRLTAATMEAFRDSLGYNRRFPTGGIGPENASQYDGYGAIAAVPAASATTHPTPTLSFIGTSQPRLLWTGTGNTQFIGNTTTPAQNIIGTAGLAPNLGGMELLMRIVLPEDALGTRKFLGISNVAVTDRFVTLNPSARPADAVVGIGAEDTTSAGGAWQLYYNAGVGPVTQVSTGVLKVVGHLYQLRIWSPRGVAKWYVELIDFDAQTRFFTSLTANIPTCGQGMMTTLVSRRLGTAPTDGFAITGMWTFLW